MAISNISKQRLMFYFPLTLMVSSCIGPAYAQQQTFEILHQLNDKPTLLTDGPHAGQYYVPSTLDNITWGYLPNKTAKPVLSVPSRQYRYL